MCCHDPFGESLSGAGGKWTRLILAAAALLALSLALSACGAGGPGGDEDGSITTTSSPGASKAHPSGNDQVVLQMTTGGGLVPIEYNVTLVPEFSLYGDGRVIVPGSIDAIYPGPALPNPLTAVIPEGSIQAILTAAREAGLFDPTFDYGLPTVADDPTTTIVINAGGTTCRLEIYALTVGAVGGLTTEQQQARAALNALRGKLMDLTAFVSGQVAWEQYEFSALAVYSQAVDPNSTPDTTEVQPNRLEWPLGDLGTLGEEVPRPGFRRVVVSGEDLEKLRPLLDQATQITLWNSAGSEYHLFFRALLPEETA